MAIILKIRLKRNIQLIFTFCYSKITNKGPEYMSMLLFPLLSIESQLYLDYDLLNYCCREQENEIHVASSTLNCIQKHRQPKKYTQGITT
jgi:hypothetical protein